MSATDATTAPAAPAAPAPSPAQTSPVTVVNSLEEFHKIINGDEPAIFDFWAPWCGPCKVISPIFERFASVTTGMKFYKVNTDDQPVIMHEVGVRAMPTFAVFQKGEKKAQVLGARPQLIVEMIQKHKSLDTK